MMALYAEKYKIPKKYILINLVPLLMMLIASIVDASGTFNFLVFVSALFLIYILTKKISNLTLFIYAVYINSSLMTGSIGFLSITKISAIIMVIALLHALFKQRKKIERIDRNFLAIVIIWMLYLSFHVLFITHSDFSRLIVAYIPLMIVLTSMLVAVGKDCEKDKFIWMVFIAFFMIIIVAIVEHIIGHTFFYIRWTHSERYRNGILRIGSTVADPNNVCFMLVPFFFMLQTTIFKRLIPKTLRAIALILDFVIVLLTSSRAGILALFIGIAIAIISKKRATLLFVVPIMIAAFDFATKQFELLLNKYDKSTGYREYIVEQALLVWNQHKIFGAGSKVLFDTIELENTMNTYIYVLGVYGIIGMIIFLLYIFLIIKKDVYHLIKDKHISNDISLKLSIIVTVLIMAYSLDVFGLAIIWIIPALFQMISDLDEIHVKRNSNNTLEKMI